MLAARGVHEAGHAARRAGLHALWGARSLPQFYLDRVLPAKLLVGDFNFALQWILPNVDVGLILCRPVSDATVADFDAQPADLVEERCE